ncbi:reverse transcriptase domain-containing protein [Tanacetum coccineum]
MISENKFDGIQRADPHDHIREFLAICNMFRYGETQSEAVKLLIFPFSLCDEAKTGFNELNEESIISWEQMRRAFINRFFPPSLFNRLLLEIRNFSQNICESLTESWLRLKNMLRKCNGHGIFLYKSPNQAFQFLDDKVLFNHDWPIKSKNGHHQKSVAFAYGSNSNNDKFRLMEKLASLTIKMDSQIISLNEELQDMREKYKWRLRNGNASKNHLNDDTPTCERHEANYIQSEGYQNRNSQNSYSHQTHHNPNDSEKSLTKLNNDVRKDLKDFKRCVRSLRTVHDKLYDRDDGKTTGVLPKKKSKTVNQEPQTKTDLEKSITKFLDGQRITNMFFKNNVNDMILKMKQNEKNFQTKIKNMERKIDEWEKSQNVFSKQTDRTNPPPPPQAQTKQVNVVFTGNGKSDDSLKIQKDPPPSIIVNNKSKRPPKIKEGNELKQMKRKGDNRNNEQPIKRVSKAEKFEAIKYSLGPNEEYIAVRRCEYNTWEINEEIIMEYLVKISKKARILKLKQRNMKIIVLTTNTPYPSWKIRRICACTSQKTMKETRSIRRKNPRAVGVSLPNVSKSISEVTALKGVGPAAVLAAFTPDVATFMSDEEDYIEGREETKITIVKNKQSKDLYSIVCATIVAVGAHATAEVVRFTFNARLFGRSLKKLQQFRQLKTTTW